MTCTRSANLPVYCDVWKSSQCCENSLVHSSHTSGSFGLTIVSEAIHFPNVRKREIGGIRGERKRKKERDVGEEERGKEEGGRRRGKKKHAISSYVCIHTVISCGLPI